MTETALTIKHVPTASLTLDDRNARTHGRRNLDAIKASLVAFGQRRPLVVMPDGTVIAGNGTLEAIRELGWADVAVTVVPADWTAEQARAYALADNRTAELAAWDSDVLLDTLSELDAAGWSVDALGWDTRDLARIDGSVEVVEDDAPDVPSDPVCTVGDSWQLGRHRLVVGDARDPLVVAAAAGGVLADCMWTDPPYGVNYVGKTADALTIENDAAADLPELLAASFGSVSKVLRAGIGLYVAHPSGPLQAHFVEAFLAAGWTLRQTLVWVKDHIVLGRSDYHYKHEPILYGYTPSKGRKGRGSVGWYGDDSQSSVFEIAKPKRNAEHPTMKPVELVARCIVNSTKRGGLVLDPFAGSGTTLIAAEQTERTAACVEIAPGYADVIVDRWQALTGEKATREHD